MSNDAIVAPNETREQHWVDKVSLKSPLESALDHFSNNFPVKKRSKGLNNPPEIVVTYSFGRNEPLENTFIVLSRVMPQYPQHELESAAIDMNTKNLANAQTGSEKEKALRDVVSNEDFARPDALKSSIIKALKLISMNQDGTPLPKRGDAAAASLKDLEKNLDKMLKLIYTTMHRTWQKNPVSDYRDNPQMVYLRDYVQAIKEQAESSGVFAEINKKYGSHAAVRAA